MRFGRWGRTLGGEGSDFVFWEIKLRIYFGAASCHLETIIFVHGQVMFPYLIFVILRFVTWKIFFGKLEQKNWNSLFFRFLCSKKLQKSDGSCNDSSDVRFLMQTFQKSNLFDTAKTYEPNFVCNDYFIVNHWDKLWILLNGSYRNKLLGDTDELLQKFRNWTLSIPHTNTWTVSIYYSSTN